MPANDARARHDFEMPPHNTVEGKRRGIERDQAEIARQPDDAAADRVSENAPDINASVIATTIIAGSSAKPLMKMKPKPSTILIALWSIGPGPQDR